MFWGSFAGTEKGPYLFWEKDWGSIDSEQYCQKIVPLIDGMVRLRPFLSVMQDNAPSHSAARTMQEFHDRRIIPIKWPPCSPDLNPIESVWNKMKYFIQFKYPDIGDGKQRSYDKLRDIVKEAWESVTSEDLMNLIRTMPERCQAVLDAEGGPTRF